jgi:hypothetical protein
VDVAERLASSLGQNSDEPNVELAEELAAAPDPDAVDDLVGMLGVKPAARSSDAIKVLYELASRDPDAVAPHADEIASHLASRDNRLVWGAASALDAIAQARPDAVAPHVDALIAAVRAGSVITQDRGVSALAATGRDDALTFVLEHLATCGAKYLPFRTERCAPHLTGAWRERLLEVARPRLPELSDSGRRRLERVLRG